MNSTFRISLLVFLTLLTAKAFAQNIAGTIESEKNNKENLTISPNKCVKPSYPRIALRNELEGDTVLLLTVGESGKVDRVEIEKSSGWRILDDAASNFLLGCQVTSMNTNSKILKTFTYRWSLGNNNKTPPTSLYRERCRSSEKVKFAEHDEPGRGIVIGRTDSNITLEWGSGNIDLDVESVEIVKSCKLVPPFSVRFLPK